MNSRAHANIYGQYSHPIGLNISTAESHRLWFRLMMLRLPSRVAHWSGCLSIGLLAGSVVQAISSSIGAGPGSLLGTAALSAVALGVMSWWRFGVKPAGYAARISLILTPVAIGALDWIQLGTSWATHSVLGATTETWLISSVILGAALIPTAATALRASCCRSACHCSPWDSR